MNDKLLSKMLIFLLMISPIFDLHIFYNSISTLIRVMYILIMFLLTIKIYKKDKIRNYLYIYLGIVVVYFVFHDLNARTFKSLVPGNFSYSTFDEILYFIKMIMSSILIYIVYKGKLKLDDLNVPLVISILFISGSIVITNLFGVSYSSYGFDLIKGNIFTWFSNNYLFNEVASKGLFEMANQIVAVLLLYLPLILYFTYKKFNALNIISAITLLISMLMLGTRLSVYGSLFTLITFIMTYVFFIVIKKEKTNIKFILFLLVVSLLFGLMINYSPVKLKSDFYTDIYQNKDVDKTEKTTTVNTKVSNGKLDYIKNNYEKKKIYKYFIINSYPYEYDPEFWLEIMEEPIENRVDTRFLEEEIVERIEEVNDNDLDTVLGISYTRIQNVFNIERDYIMQYHSLGIIGVILFLGIYLSLLIISIIKTIKDDFTLENVILIVSVSIMLLSAYFSGNILNSISCIIPLSIMCGVLIRKVKCGKIDNGESGCCMREKIEKIVSVYKRDGLLVTTKKIFKHVKYVVFFAHNPRYVIDFWINKNRYSKFIDEILASDYDRIIVWRGSFGWRVPLFQRPQHIARELSYQKCLMFYSTYKDDKVLTFDKVYDNLYLINYQNKRFVSLLEDKLNKINKPKYCQIYSTDWFKSVNDIKEWIKEGYKIIYEYVDDLSPDLTGTKNLADNIKEKYKFCSMDKNNALVVVTADQLYDDIYKIRKDKNVVFSSNGVEYEHFKNVKKTEEVSTRLLEIVNLKKPIIGYYGALASWFDYSLIKYISEKRKDYQIVLIGLKYDDSYDKSRIDSLENVHYLGSVDYKDLPKYAVYFDIAMIPFLINDITKATSPCKLFEYMSLNKPIVTTDLKECHKYKSVMIGKDSDEFVKLLDKSLDLIMKKDKKYFDLLKKEALENTWKAKAKLIIEGLIKMEKDK